MFSIRDYWPFVVLLGVNIWIYTNVEPPHDIAIRTIALVVRISVLLFVFLTCRWAAKRRRRINQVNQVLALLEAERKRREDQLWKG